MTLHHLRILVVVLHVCLARTATRELSARAERAPQAVSKWRMRQLPDISCCRRSRTPWCLLTSLLAALPKGER